MSRKIPLHNDKGFISIALAENSLISRNRPLIKTGCFFSIQCPKCQNVFRLFTYHFKCPFCHCVYKITRSNTRECKTCVLGDCIRENTAYCKELPKYLNYAFDGVCPHYKAQEITYLHETRFQMAQLMPTKTSADSRRAISCIPAQMLWVNRYASLFPEPFTKPVRLMIIFVERMMHKLHVYRKAAVILGSAIYLTGILLDYMNPFRDIAQNLDISDTPLRELVHLILQDFYPRLGVNALKTIDHLELIRERLKEYLVANHIGEKENDLLL